MTKNNFKFQVKSLNEMANFAKKFATVLKPGLLICLYGEIGSGKTTFIQYTCKELGITENVTSPSFVILNEYYSGKFPVYHFDLYRLEKDGIESIISELSEYSTNDNCVAFIEWPEFSNGILPEDRLDLFISYDENFSNARTIELIALSNKAKDLLKKLENISVNS